MNKRQLSILKKISDSTEINVNQLALEYGVSQVTIRSDLSSLERNGMLERYHGGARAVSDDDIMKRMSSNYDVKVRIAKRAASYISDGETLMIESGSTNALLAQELTKKRDITIITNSAFIARFVRSSPSTKITLIGGDYQPESEVMVGPLARLCLGQFNVDKLFVGVDGFSEGTGFTCINLMRAEAAHSMSKRANKLFVLTESGKFETVGVSDPVCSKRRRLRYHRQRHPPAEQSIS